MIDMPDSEGVARAGGFLMSCVDLLVRRPLGGLSEASPAHHLELRPTSESARAARAFVAAHLSVGPTALDTITLLTSELVTNAILHARTELVVGVTQGPHVVLVTVGDRSSSDPVQRQPDDSRPSGRGMVLVESMADEWGVEHHEYGKTVWFTVVDDRGDA